MLCDSEPMKENESTVQHMKGTAVGMVISVNLTEFEFRFIGVYYVVLHALLRFIRIDTTRVFPTNNLDELQSGLSNPQSTRGSFEAVQLFTNEDTIGVRFHYRVTF